MFLLRYDQYLKEFTFACPACRNTIYWPIEDPTPDNCMFCDRELFIYPDLLTTSKNARICYHLDKGELDGPS